MGRMSELMDLKGTPLGQWISGKNKPGLDKKNPQSDEEVPEKKKILEKPPLIATLSPEERKRKNLEEMDEGPGSNYPAEKIWESS